MHLCCTAIVRTTAFLLLAIAVALHRCARGQQIFIPPPPCTNETVASSNFHFAVQQAGVFSLSVETAARTGTLGGASNHIGDLQHPIVNSLVFGSNGTVRHSNSVLFAYGNRATMTRRNNELRLMALNGVHFEATQVWAAGVLIRDDETRRDNVTTLTEHLSGQSVTATGILAALTPYRFRWNDTFSPEDRHRYGFLPSEAALIDTHLAPLVHTVAKETEPAAIVNDTKAGVCQLENSGPTQPTSDSSEGGSIDLVSLVALLTESIRELDARVTVLEP